VLLFGLGGAVVAAGSLVGLGAHVHRVGRRPRSEGAPRPAVVLGARVYADGRPSDALVDRVRVGVELLRAGEATALLLSGGSPDGRPTEAEVMRQLALSLGAPPGALWLEERSRSTFENAVECARLLAARRVEAVWLVTCDFHVARATAHFRRAGLEVAAAPSRRELAPSERLLVTARELGGLLRRPGLLRHCPR
jgi:uncharacterized SAM-binding protein YcdF (DUF218 family)